MTTNGSIMHGCTAPESCFPANTKAIRKHQKFPAVHLRACSHFLWSAPCMGSVSKISLHHCTVGLKFAQKQSSGSSVNTALRAPFLPCPLSPEVLHLQAGRSPGLLVVTLLMNNHRQIFSPEINMSRKGQL